MPRTLVLLVRFRDQCRGSSTLYEIIKNWQYISIGECSMKQKICGKTLIIARGSCPIFHLIRRNYFINSKILDKFVPFQNLKKLFSVSSTT